MGCVRDKVSIYYRCEQVNDPQPPHPTDNTAPQLAHSPKPPPSHDAAEEVRQEGRAEEGRAEEDHLQEGAPPRAAPLHRAPLRAFGGTAHPCSCCLTPSPVWLTEVAGTTRACYQQVAPKKVAAKKPTPKKAAAKKAAPKKTIAKKKPAAKKPAGKKKPAAKKKSEPTSFALLLFFAFRRN